MKPATSIPFLACLILAFTACDQAEKQSSLKADAVSESEVEIAVPEVDEEIPGMDDATVPPGHVAKSLKEWIPEFHRVDAMVYDYQAGESAWLVRDDKLHPGVVKSFTKTLSKTEVDRLESFVTGSRNGGWGAMCYDPHHGFVFYDEANQILGHLEICFMCQNYKYAPRTDAQIQKSSGPLSQNWDLNGMEALLKDKGFPVLDSHQKWKAFFAAQK